jgi:hypothetical protein
MHAAWPAPIRELAPVVLSVAGRTAFGAARDDHVAEMTLVALREPAGLNPATLLAE